METKKMRILKSNLPKARNQQGFSLIGILTASLMGIIVTLGLTKMMSNMNSEVTQMKATAHRIDLLTQISSIFAGDCQASLGQSLSPAQLTDLKKGGSGSNKAPIQWTLLKDGDENEILNTDDQDPDNKDKMKRLYNMEGHSRFQLKCKDATGCDCTSSPCAKNWILSLFTMNYKNNLPIYQEMYKQGLRIAYPTGSNSSQFTCNFAPLTSKEKWQAGEGACGQHTTGSGLTCIGYYAGYKNSTGSNNTFFGRQAGRGSGPIISDHNTFFGSHAGNKIRPDSSDPDSGTGNTFFGHFAGYNNTEGSYNTIFAYYDKREKQNHPDSTGSYNTFFGLESGHNTIGSNNLFLGAKAGKETSTENNRVNIANTIYAYVEEPLDDKDTYPVGAKGIAVHGQIQVCTKEGDNCEDVPTGSGQSSREYKKNIVPFRDYQKALELLLTTPLFTYQYIEDHPEKQRMGVIAEELPLSLQLPVEPGAPGQPDWPSIYGHLWAGIKALHQELQIYSNNLNNSLCLEQSLVPTDSVCLAPSINPALCRFSGTPSFRTLRESRKSTRFLKQDQYKPLALFHGPPYQGGNPTSEIGNMNLWKNPTSETRNMNQWKNPTNEIENTNQWGNPTSETRNKDTKGIIDEMQVYQQNVLGDNDSQLTHSGIINEMQSYQQSIEEIEKDIAQLKKQEEIFQQELQKLKQQIQTQDL